MAEFEKGYCTGCGVYVAWWGHRPFCWRYMEAKYSLTGTCLTRKKLLKEMHAHWRIRALFLVKKKHMYYHYYRP